MSMISEQVKELRQFARKSKELNRRIDERIFREAADTIETLSAKLAKENMERSDRYYNGGWILCSDRLPEKDGYYEVTVDRSVDLEKINVAEFQYFYSCHRKWAECVDSKFLRNVIAWQPLPEPYKPQ